MRERSSRSLRGERDKRQGGDSSSNLNSDNLATEYKYL